MREFRVGEAVRRGAAAAITLMLVAGSAGADEAPLGDLAARTVVVMAFDGVTPSLLTSARAPAFDRLRREGSATHRLVPPFPAAAAVIAFTLSTGCWPQRHGIVAGRFADPRRGEYDGSLDADWVLGCEGMHQAAERQGVRAAALGWPGARSEKKGPQATFVSGKAPAAATSASAQRADEIVRLLRTTPEARPRLLLAYVPATVPDDEGPDAAEQAVREADAAVAGVLSTIDAMTDGARVALFVTARQGRLPATRRIDLERALATRGIRARTRPSGSVALVYLDDASDSARAAQALAGVREIEAFTPDKAPGWARVGTSDRLGDLVVVVRPPFFLEDVAGWPAWARWIEGWAPEGLWRRTADGYPPDTPNVEGVLYARGSGIARGRAVPELRLVDVHPTALHLLAIDPGRPMDGHVMKEILE